MIPNRMLSNEFCGSGLKQRVTACRKRLRVYRYHQRLYPTAVQSLFAPETSASFPAEYVAVRESLISDDDASEQQEREAWIRPEQEVGIT